MRLVVRGQFSVFIVLVSCKRFIFSNVEFEVLSFNFSGLRPK